MLLVLDVHLDYSRVGIEHGYNRTHNDGYRIVMLIKNVVGIE